MSDFSDIDTSYDLWIERLREPEGVHLYGVIDMGDAYQGVYIWDGREWNESFTYRASEVINRIVRARR